MRRTLSWSIAFTVLLALSLPAGARPNDEVPPPNESQAVPPGLVDRNNDRISDGLAAHLTNRGPQEKVNVVVTWTQAPDLGTARNAAGPFDIHAEFDVIDGFAASLTAGQIIAMSKVPGVFRVEEDFQVSVANDEANADFGIVRARNDFGVDGTGVVFCVADTGVDVSHEQLDAGKVVAWLDVINGQPNPYDDQGHGTHVASTLGGDGIGGPNAFLYRGVAPRVGIAAVKVLNSAGTGTESQIIQGIDWCISRQVDGISMSLGTSTGSDGNDALSLAIDNAVTNHGIVSVIAAGNSGDGLNSVGSPGAARGAVTVGAAAKVADGVRLAGFSSRGPTLDGRQKPDVVSPGVAITAAQFGTGSGYVGASGTSMATPFTAGVVALMIDCNAALTAPQIKSLLGSSATDLGPVGADNNWGNGLIDGYQALASVCNGSGGMSLAGHDHVQGTVPNNGTYTHTFDIESDGVGKPIAATILIQGQMICTFEFFGICFIWEWVPDLDARLLAPGGAVIWQSECPLAGECGTIGQSEVITATASQAGEYRIEIYAFGGSPNNGLGGSFVMDLFYGPIGGDPTPPNLPPVATSDAYTTNEDSALAVAVPGVLGNDTDPDTDPLTASLVSGPGSGTLALNANGSFDYSPNANFNGADSFVYRASDGRGGTSQATATITVNPVNDPPLANAGPDQTVVDSDANGSQAVTLNGTGSNDPDGTPLSYSWSENTTVLATVASPTVVLAVGAHTLTLSVSDGQATAIDTVTVTVQAAPTSNAIHVADLDSSTSWNARRTKWTGAVTVLVHTAAHGPLSGVRVNFSLSDGTSKSCTTGTAGTCVVSKAQGSTVASLTYTIRSLVASGRTYAAGSNHDPDGDSNGSAILVTRPQ